MLRVIWRNLVARRLRLLLSAFAIVLGVSFVSGALVFTHAIGAVFDGIIEDSTSDVEVAYKGAGDFDSFHGFLLGDISANARFVLFFAEGGPTTFAPDTTDHSHAFLTGEDLKISAISR